MRRISQRAVKTPSSRRSWNGSKTPSYLEPNYLSRRSYAQDSMERQAQHGESTVASASSIYDMSAGRRGGLRSHPGPGGRTLLQLRNEARQRGLKGRSKMDKAQLETALQR